jgi:hypothetical protein
MEQTKVEVNGICGCSGTVTEARSDNKCPTCTYRRICASCHGCIPCRQEGNSGESNTASSKEKNYIAKYPLLVDVLDNNGKLVFVTAENGRLHTLPAVMWNGVTCEPPPKEQLSWNDIGIPTLKGVKAAYDMGVDTQQLFHDVREYMKPLAAVPYDEIWDFLALWIFHTYITDHPHLHYSGEIYLYGDGERGKGKILVGLQNLAYRPELTETVNMATMFRFSEHVAGTLLIDSSDFWNKVLRKDADDFFLNRFEKGRKTHRVTHPEAGPFQDMNHYSTFGATGIATNSPVPEVMHSRCFPIEMPLAPGRYPPADRVQGLRLRERLLAWRALQIPHYEKPLPVPDVVGEGRWQDISGVMTQIAKLIGIDTSRLRVALKYMKGTKEEQTRDTIEALIIRTLFRLKDQIGLRAGRLELKWLTEALDAGVSEKSKISRQMLGHLLTAMSIRRTNNRKYII